jgi:hypothetical protein
LDDAFDILSLDICTDELGPGEIRTGFATTRVPAMTKSAVSLKEIRAARDYRSRIRLMRGRWYWNAR